MLDSRYLFKANAVGAAAHVTRIDPESNLYHVVPAVGSSALPIIGGHHRSEHTNFCFGVEKPRKLTILAVKSAVTHVEGKKEGKAHRTIGHSTVRDFSLLDQVHAELIYGELIGEHAEKDPHAVIVPNGKIEGLRLGDYALEVTIDPAIFAGGTKAALAERFATDAGLHNGEGWRVNATPGAKELPLYGGGAYHVGSLVRQIRWVNKAHPDVTIEGYTLKWRGFGRIYLGEILVGAGYTRLVMLRAEMGSPVAGSATAGSVDDNGAGMP